MNKVIDFAAAANARGVAVMSKAQIIVRINELEHLQRNSLETIKHTREAGANMGAEYVEATKSLINEELTKLAEFKRELDGLRNR